MVSYPRRRWIHRDIHWALVLSEVADLMPVGGTLPPDDIPAGLGETVRPHEERFDVDTPRNQSVGRAGYGKYFEKALDGTLVRNA